MDSERSTARSHRIESPAGDDLLLLQEEEEKVVCASVPGLNPGAGLAPVPLCGCS